MNYYETAFAILLILFVIMIIIPPVAMLIYTKKRQLKITLLPKNKLDYKLLITQNQELKTLKTKQEKKINNLEKQLTLKQTIINELQASNEAFLLKVNDLSANDAKQALFAHLNEKYRKEVANNFLKIKKEFNDSFNLYAQNILIDVMERSSEPLVVNRSLFTINFADENLKGKIIGRDGRNKALFETIGGVDLIVDRNDTILSISSPNPIRREIAKRVISKLIESRNIDMNRIELLFAEERERFEFETTQTGKDIIENKLGFFDIPEGLYPYIGRMQFRSSYGQNILSHSLEAANYAQNIAQLLGIDEILAKKCAFFHDIGKVIDFDTNLDHVDAGVLLAKKFGLCDEIVNAIESHHNKVIATSIYGALVKVVDTLSAARPGARIASYEEYFGRVSELEKICLGFKGIKAAYVIKSGRQIRAIVDANIVSDDELELLAHEVKTAIEQHEVLANYKVNIMLIKEKRVCVGTNTIS